MIRAFIGDAPIIDDAEAPAALVVTAGVRLPDLLRASCTMCHWENEAEPGESYPAGMRCPSCNSDVHIEPVNMEPRIDSIVSLHIAGDVELRTSEGGTRIDRATVRDGNGDVVANFVNVPSAYDLALRWSKHVDACPEGTPSKQWTHWDAGQRPRVLCRRIWREMAAAHELVGAPIDVDLPTGARIRCEGCGWTDYDHFLTPPNGACPECGKLFTVTEVPDEEG